VSEEAVSPTKKEVKKAGGNYTNTLDKDTIEKAA
jgi:hypothetical protein